MLDFNKGRDRERRQEERKRFGLVYLTGSQLLMDYLIPKFDSYLNVGF